MIIGVQVLVPILGQPVAMQFQEGFLNEMVETTRR